MKIYTVNISSMYLGLSSNPIKAFKKELDAILYVEENNSKKPAGMFGSYNHYSIIEIDYEEIIEQDPKKIKKIVEMKVKELDEKMLSNTKAQDEKNIMLVKQNESLALRKKELLKYFE